MSNTNDDTNMTGNADNCDPLRTKSGQDEHGEWTTFPCGTRTRIDAIDSDGLIRLTVVAPVPVTRIEAEIDIGRDIAQSAADHIAEQTGKPAQPLSELAKLINSWDEYMLTVEREIAERAKPETAPLANCRNALRDAGKAYPKSGCAICGDAGLLDCPYEKTPPGERPTPITDAEWQTECCSGAPWYRIAERMMHCAADLERQLAEVTSQRDASHQKCRDYRLVALGAEDALEKMKAQRDALVEALTVAMARAYAAGYQHGHDDSVEARFIIVDQAEAKEHFAEDVKQMLLDGSQPEAAAALAAVKGGEA